MRQLSEDWGKRDDKDRQLWVGLPDSSHWKRVRYWGFKHFTGFRYGDDHHAIAVVFLLDVEEGKRHNSKLCMRRFESWVRPQIRNYEVKLEQIQDTESKFKDGMVPVRYVDGKVRVGFNMRRFSAAWAAYDVYPDACMIYAVAVPWDDEGDLAQQVRDRWVQEGFGRVYPGTKERPYRKE